MLRPFASLRKKLGYLNRQQLDLVHSAYRMAADAHAGQRRQTGETYIHHPVAVAIILAELHLDHESIIAALLHDVLEDTAVEKTEIFESFGQSVADLVDGVTKLAQINFKDRAEAQAESFRKMVLAMSHDIRVIMVKLADRMHNLRTISICRYEKRARVAKETLAIYAPIAYRLGMHVFSQELKALSLKAWHPKRYQALKNAVKMARGNRKEVMSVVIKALKEGLAKSALDFYEITGREKNIYGIYKKMCDKKLSFSEIMDVYGFRLLVDSVDDCYRALGVVHGIYRPRMHRFKDYVAVPKPNGYRSIHTGLYGPFGLPIEIQIRTVAMEELATSGIVAHWKQGETTQDIPNLQVQHWLKSLLEIQQRTGSPIEFIENVKMDLFPEGVYAFTPKGRLVELPAGSTVIDFAYAVHTDVGNHCVAAKVNLRVAPLSATLKNGQVVEIITAKKATPNPMWLHFTATGKAKSSIRHALKTMKLAESIKIGRRLLVRACLDLGFALKDLPESVVNQVFGELKVKDADGLFLSVGLGHRNANMVANRLTMLINDHNHSVGDLKQAAVQDTPLVIQGTEGLAVVFSGCCSPVPGDEIVALMQPGQGVSVHRNNCETFARDDRSNKRLVTVQWSPDIERHFTARLEVLLKDEHGALAQVTACIATLQVGISDMVLRHKDPKYANLLFTLTVKHASQLAAIERVLKQSKQVVDVCRHLKDSSS